MPHTRAARLKALKDLAEFGNMQQMQNWNDYLDWDLPDLTYIPDALAWVPGEGATASDQLSYIDDDPSAATSPSDCLTRTNHEESSNANFCGLQQWYSTGAQDMSSAASAIITRPSMSGSEYTSYESTSLDEKSKPTLQLYEDQPWPPNCSRQTSSRSDGVHSQRALDDPAVDLTEELEERDDAPSPSSGKENARASIAKLDASKKRKMAHSVIEKNYRSRINDGMAELRQCVPTTARGRFSLDSKGPGGQVAAEGSTPNHSSGKVITLSDAVLYVKALELHNETLQGQLDVMQRRNHTLQKIALSKVNMSFPTNTIDTDDQEANYTHTSKKVKKSLSGRARRDDSRSGRPVGGDAEKRQKDANRTVALAHALSLSQRRDSGRRTVTRKLGAIKISDD